MGPLIAYDLTRLFLAPWSLAPRGIDRVDLATARHFFPGDDNPNLGVLPTPWGVRTFEAKRVRRGLGYIERLWSEDRHDGPDPHWTRLVNRLNGRQSSPAPPAEGRPAGKVRRLLGELGATGVSAGGAVRRALPRGAVYLNIGQIGLAVPAFHGWLADRPDVAAVYMLHDAIPLDHPQFVAPVDVLHHRRMIRTAARHADGLVMTTHHAHATVKAALAEFTDRHVPALVRGLPVPGVLAEPRDAAAALAGRRYFVVCSTIEPRKNHALLFDVWRRLVAMAGADAPHLVVVGGAGRHAGEILAPLAEPLLCERVHHVAGLSCQALARLLLGAAALLSPSLAEGFGLPLHEARALGVPAIASDIPAHREIGGADTTLLPCDDIEGWGAAIMACLPAPRRTTPRIAWELSEAAYGSDLQRFLGQCAARKADAQSRPDLQWSLAH